MSGDATIASGAWAILATPFTTSEDVDADGLSVLTSFYIDRGAAGVVTLAVMGEGHKVSDAERTGIVKTVLDASMGRVPVVVGVTAPSTRLVRRRTAEARDAGAAAVLISPLTGMAPEGILELYREAGREGLPIVLQDHPTATGVTMTATLIGRILAEVEAVVAVKNEAPPTGPRTGQVLSAAGGKRVTVLGGLGALNLLDELDEGSHGTMTGFSFPEALVRIVQLHRSGDRQEARRLYEAFLPWLLFEATAVFSLAIRKEFLRLRGLIEKAVVRGPTAQLDRVLTERAAELAAAFPYHLLK